MFLFLRYSKMESFFLKYHFLCHRRFHHKRFRDSGRPQEANLKILQNTLLLYCFRSYFITVIIFSVLVHQMCALNTKKFVFAYSFSFGETSWKHLKMTPVRDVIGRPQDVNLIIIHKMVFREIFLYSVVQSIYQTLKSQNNLKNLIRPILVLLWSGTSRPK